MKQIAMIVVDFQKEFTLKGGICFNPRKSVKFVKDTLIPFFVKKNVKVAEIVSDYRQKRLGGRLDLCHPGKRGYESEIPKEVKMKNVWIKAENSPLWTRKNAGKANKKPGLPYQDPRAFTKWLNSTIGKPQKDKKVILFGLTLDCCVLCVAQELKFRGYKVFVLEEGVDSYSGSQKEKKTILNNPPLTNFAKPISWKKLKPTLN